MTKSAVHGGGLRSAPHGPLRGRPECPGDRAADPCQKERSRRQSKKEVLTPFMSWSQKRRPSSPPPALQVEGASAAHPRTEGAGIKEGVCAVKPPLKRGAQERSDGGELCGAHDLAIKTRFLHSSALACKHVARSQCRLLQTRLRSLTTPAICLLLHERRLANHLMSGRSTPGSNCINLLGRSYRSWAFGGREGELSSLPSD